MTQKNISIYNFPLVYAKFAVDYNHPALSTHCVCTTDAISHLALSTRVCTTGDCNHPALSTRWITRVIIITNIKFVSTLSTSSDIIIICTNL